MCKNDPAAKRAAYFTALAADAKRVAENIRKDRELKEWRRLKAIEHVNNAYHSIQYVDVA